MLSLNDLRKLENWYHRLGYVRTWCTGCKVSEMSVVECDMPNKLNMNQQVMLKGENHSPFYWDDDKQRD
jgi:hypothetical protein